MKKMFIRLDDACPRRNIANWDRMEKLLDDHNIRPLVGVIPDCKDPDMDKYEEDIHFWDEKIIQWKKKKWELALHGYQHIFNSDDGGINPVNKRSEFAGLPLDVQRRMIKEGIRIFEEHGITPHVFFAPAHTYDENTLLALKEESNIRIISDTPANDAYYRDGFVFIPQQSGRVRYLPFKTITFCYHPNIMSDSDFEVLEQYMRQNRINSFAPEETTRKLSIFDRVLIAIYYKRHGM